MRKSTGDTRVPSDPCNRERQEKCTAGKRNRKLRARFNSKSKKKRSLEEKRRNASRTQKNALLGKILAGPASRCVIDTTAAIHEGRKDGAVLPDESVGPVRTFFSALFNRRSDAHCPSLPMCHACAVHCTCGRVPADAH